MMSEYKAYYQSPIGLVQIKGTDNQITELKFVDNKGDGVSNPYLEEAVRQVDEYFNKKRQVFDLNLSLAGTEFQSRVWNSLIEVGFGKTASYKDIACAAGNEKAARAVGMANNRNPISIIVPCHRIIGSNGKLVGYGGGLWRKEWLLKHEGIEN
jgi:methylated-DNA-[protein]-cysteine S-methyltransferase